MQSNSKVIGVVVCIVCCIGALCILPLAGSSDNDLQGWNSSQMYDGLINPSDSEFFTDAVLEERANGGLASTPHVSSTGSRMFHHSSASTMSAQGMGMGSSYAGASVHTTSSAAMSGSGSSISPISTSTATGSKAGSSMGGGAIYATSTSVSPRSGSASGSSLISSSALSAPTASRAAAPMMSASSATSGNPSAMYASNMSSNYGTASYCGYSGPKGVSGRQRIGGLGGGEGTDLGNAMFGAFFKWLIEQSTEENPTYLYGGMATSKYENTGQEYWWFLESDIYGWWLKYCETAGISKDEAENLWNNRFYQWFNDKESNTTYRFPIPDGVGVLLVLSLLCVLFTFLRSRDKKILEETEKTN